MLVHGEGDRFGEPYRLEPWMRDALLQIYRFDPDSFERVTRRAVIGIAKGNAKTEFAAALALAETAGWVVPWSGVVDGHPPRQPVSPNVPIAAASYDQARLCYGAAAAMAQQGELGPQFDIFEKEMRLVDRPGRLYRIAAEASTQEGTLPTAFVADELHEWTGRKARVHLVVANSLLKRASGLEINISTAGDPDRSDLLFDLYEYGSKVASGEVVDDSFVFLWWEADEGLDVADPVQLREAIAQANPSSWMEPGRIAQRLEVDRIPQSEFARYHLNRWVSSGESWLPVGVWDSLVARRDLPAGTTVTLGFDGSHNHDSTALIGCTLDGHLFEWRVWERPENARDWRVPRSEVDAAVDEAFRRFDVVELACDPAKWSLYVDEWTERYGDRVTEYIQARERMAPATSKFYDAAVNELLSHDGSVTLARHVANATIKQVPGRRYVLQKDHPDRKIDAAVAAVMAYDRATWRRDATVDVTAMLV